MLLQQRKQIVLKLYEALDKHDFEQARKLISTNLIAKGMDKTRKGIDEFMPYAMSFYTAFPDGYHVFEEVIAEDNRVVTRGTFSGTHRGELMGISPTGKQVKFQVVHFDTVIEDCITEHWGQFDKLDMIKQLGSDSARC